MNFDQTLPTCLRNVCCGKWRWKQNGQSSHFNGRTMCETWPTQLRSTQQNRWGCASFFVVLGTFPNFKQELLCVSSIIKSECNLATTWSYVCTNIRMRLCIVCCDARRQFQTQFKIAALFHLSKTRNTVSQEYWLLQNRCV